MVILDFQPRIAGQTKQELINDAIKESIKLGWFKAKVKNALKKKDRVKLFLYEPLMDAHGTLAHVNLLRVGLFDHILRSEVMK